MATRHAPVYPSAAPAPAPAQHPATPSVGPPSAGADMRSDELRLALVLNGGVSLAVWMGGVAFELNRLVRETHPVYRGLLELTDTAARIDVISGTSAGGINGAALALAQVHDSSLYGLRDVWLETAGLERLLRDPDDKNPSSLLQGDTWFLPQIRRAFADLARGEPSPADKAPLFLSLTTTLLGGHLDQRLDDFGATVEDTVHRALWRYERSEGPGNDAFVHPRIVDQLAFAARSTASFPVAFEPASYRPDDPMYIAAPLLQVRVSPELALRKRALLLDGGILDNRPFDAALDGIARLPAQGNTRRVVAYIAPDPAAAVERPEQAKAPVPAAAPAAATTAATAPAPHRDDLDAPPPPTLAQVAWRSLVTIPAAQSIAANLALLRKHNSDSSRRWERLVGAMQHVGTQKLQENAERAFPAYQARRVEGATDFLLDEIEAGLAEQRDDEFMSMRRATRQWLRSTWTATHASSPRMWAGRVPLEYIPGKPLLGAKAHGAWPWGLYALDFAVEFSVELLRRTQRLSALVERWEKGGGRGVVDDVPPIPEPRQEKPGAFWEHLDVGPSAVGRILRSDRLRIDSTGLQDEWKQAYRLAHNVRVRRRESVDKAKTVGADRFRRLVKEWRLRGGEEPPTVSASVLLLRMLRVQPENERANAADAQEVFQLIADLRRPMRRIIDSYTHKSYRAEIDEAMRELRDIHDFLYQPLPGDSRAARDRIAWRVLALEVFEVSAGSRAQAPNAQAEVVQISGRIASAWGGSDDPATKLNGMQLGHFGAFYKRSWRANDWTFGRLDGIDRAVRLALNPDALQRRFGNCDVRVDGIAQPIPASDYVTRYLYALAVGSAETDLREALDIEWEAAADKIATELAWLDQPATLPPPVLEHCAAALTRRLQMEALRRELPDMATTLIAERNAGVAPSDGAGEILARVAPADEPRVPSPKHAQELIAQNLLGAETLHDQVGSELFTRTTSHGLATAHAALSARSSGLNAINVLFKITEWPVRILYWLANRLSRSSSTGAALEGAVLGVGIALVAAGLLTKKLPNAALGLGWALLAGAVATTMLRRPPLGWILLALIFGGIVFLDPASAVQAALALVAVLLVLYLSWGSVIAMAIVILLAAYWSADVPVDALKQFWNLHHGALGSPFDVKPTAELASQVRRLQQAMVPAAFLAAMVAVSALARGAARLVPDGTATAVRRRVGAPIDTAERWLRRWKAARAAFADAWRREGRRR